VEYVPVWATQQTGPQARKLVVLFPFAAHWPGRSYSEHPSIMDNFPDICFEIKWFSSSLQPHACVTLFRRR
jgi:hypothetical protein